MNPTTLQNLQNADLAGLTAWARDYMESREPDFVISRNDRPYLRRWYLIPRNATANVYLHEFLQSDEDGALHDHPWHNASFVVDGRYIEHLADGSAEYRVAGYYGTRKPTDLHRIELLPGERAVTIFTTGPRVREWGFACPQGWKHWRDFTASSNPGATGAGCGEP